LISAQLGGMGRVPGDNEHEGFYEVRAGLPGVGLELDLHALVQAHAVFQLDLLQLLRRFAGRDEILAGDDGRLLDETVGHGARERIVEDHILERDRPARRLDERRRRQLEPQNRLQLIDGANAGGRPIAVRLVHDQHEVVVGGEIIEIAVADLLAEAADARAAAAAHLRIDLGDVEDIDGDRKQIAAAGDLPLEIVAGRDHRRRDREFRDPLQHIFFRVGREVGFQLFIDRQIRREHEEIIAAMREMQIGDEGAHQPRLADAGREREAQRREVAIVEAGDRRKLLSDRRERRSNTNPPRGRLT
jgi:hypothetical protein